MAIEELAYQFAKEVSTQLITIASALIGLSITFIKDFRPALCQSVATRELAPLYILSISLWHSIANGLDGRCTRTSPARAENFQEFTTPIRLFAGIQIVTFLAATISLIMFGWQQRDMQLQ